MDIVRIVQWSIHKIIFIYTHYTVHDMLRIPQCTCFTIHMLYLQYCTCFAIHTKMPRLYIQCPTRLYSTIPSTLYILHLHTTVYKLHPQHNMTLYTLYYAILNAPHCTFPSQHFWDIIRTVHIWKSTKAVNYTHYTTCTDCAEHILHNVLYQLYFV